MSDAPAMPTGQIPESVAGPITLSVDAMGGDRGPAAIIAGLARSVRELPDLRVILHGPKPELDRLLVKRQQLAAVTQVRHSEEVVGMGDKPAQVMRRGEKTSMWAAVDCVKTGDAAAAVSCGNTGALMAVSMLRLRKLPGVNRPAIICLWPSRNPAGFNFMLDAGADIKSDPEDLLTYALMGTSFARNGFGIARPRVGLLNVGTEENKGHPELKEANGLIEAAAARGEYDYVGFVEGRDLLSSRVDVIVTDGFTGNVALKAGEGTARLIGDFLKEAFAATVLSRFASLLAITSLRRLQRRIDPRRVNGGVFLGLNGTVVKSHGSADATGVASAIGLAFQLARSNFQARLAARVALAGLGQPAPVAAAADGAPG